jgi:hypothetical protein
MNAPRYEDPQAMRQAINDRLRRLMNDTPGTQLADLQRQFAYDRLLSRVFHAREDRWVLKGGTAMLARLGGRARHTLDVDLYNQRDAMVEAERALRAAATLDLGDHFRFTLSPGQMIAEILSALRVPVDAYLGAARFTSFRVDLSAGLVMTGVPDEVDSLVPITLPGLVRGTYRAYPIVDHVADKVCAMLEVHARLTGPPIHSTRYRDLADLTVFAHTASVDAANLNTALTAEAARRSLQLPTTLPNLDWPGWRAGYSRAARDAPDLAERDLDSALATVRCFIDPVLDGTAAGRWNPEHLAWDSDGANQC